MEVFTTEFSLCPIKSYESTSSSPMITQPGCPTPPDASDACKKIALDTSQIQIYDVIFMVIADGGAQVLSTLVKLEVVCSNKIKILSPARLISNFSQAYPVGSASQILNFNNFTTDEARCPVITYQARLIDS